MQKFLRRSIINDSVENSMGEGGRPYPRTEAPGAETPEKRLAIYSIDDSVENSIGGRPYPRTEAPGAETPEIIADSIENSRGMASPL